jgi:hypothetical protein
VLRLAANGRERSVLGSQVLEQSDCGSLLAREKLSDASNQHSINGFGRSWGYHEG